MLGFLGLSSVDELFAAVPEAIKLQQALELADGVGEPDVLAHMEGYADRNRARTDRLVCFAGGGAYDHEIPSVTRALAGRSEFVTSYTPYQPEVAQGVLQAVFEFQTMVARIAGLPVSNASLYDGGSAAVEAVNLGVAATGRQTVWVSEGIHPTGGRCSRPSPSGTGHRIRTVPLVDGVTAWPDRADRRRAARGRPGRLPQLPRLPRGPGRRPGPVRPHRRPHGGGRRSAGRRAPAVGRRLGRRRDGGGGTGVRHRRSGSAGPYLGLFACARPTCAGCPAVWWARRSTSRDRVAYVTTLRAREQDIRREKATSNVCTNQTLMAVTAAIQLGWLGTSGLVEVATRCARGPGTPGTRSWPSTGSTPGPTAPVLREFAVRLPRPADVVIERMADAGFLAGIPLTGAVEDGDHGLLIAVTERRTADQIDAYATALAKAVA